MLKDSNPNNCSNIEREFICAYNDTSPCTTGQYTLNISRKTIPDHFGRNKDCTRAIGKWPLFYRKHYQRITYHRALWQARKLELIDDQLDTIERQYPGIFYKIQLKKSEEKRLADFARATAFADDVDPRSLDLPTTKSEFRGPNSSSSAAEQLPWRQEDEAGL